LRRLAREIDYRPQYCGRVLNSIYPASPAFRRKVAAALGEDEAVLFREAAKRESIAASA
jgi:hypothetical protein